MEIFSDHYSNYDRNTMSDIISITFLLKALKKDYK